MKTDPPLPSSPPSPQLTNTTFGLHNHEPIREMPKQHCVKKKSKRISPLNSPPQIIGPFPGRSPLLAGVSPSITRAGTPHLPHSPRALQLNKLGREGENGLGFRGRHNQARRFDAVASDEKASYDWSFFGPVIRHPCAGCFENNLVMGLLTS
jgi:hypothetical protein